MPSSKSTSRNGIRTQRRRIPIKRCFHVSGNSRSNLSLSYKNFEKEDPDTELKELIIHLFKNHERYGYRRITEELKKLGHQLIIKKCIELCEN